MGAAAFERGLEEMGYETLGNVLSRLHEQATECPVAKRELERIKGTFAYQMWFMADAELKAKTYH